MPLALPVGQPLAPPEGKRYRGTVAEALNPWESGKALFTPAGVQLRGGSAPRPGEPGGWSGPTFLPEPEDVPLLLESGKLKPETLLKPARGTGGVSLLDYLKRTEEPEQIRRMMATEINIPAPAISGVEPGPVGAVAKPAGERRADESVSEGHRLSRDASGNTYIDGVNYGRWNPDKGVYEDVLTGLPISMPGLMYTFTPEGDILGMKHTNAETVLEAREEAGIMSPWEREHFEIMQEVVPWVDPEDIPERETTMNLMQQGGALGPGHISDPYYQSLTAPTEAEVYNGNGAPPAEEPTKIAGVDTNTILWIIVLVVALRYL